MDEPEKATHDLYARIPEVLWQRMKAIAKAHKRSITAEVEWALQQYTDSHTHIKQSPEAEEDAPKPRGGKKAK